MAGGHIVSRSGVADAATDAVDMSDVEVIAPNLKRRLSGVTSTIVNLVPLQLRTLGIATIGWGLPSHLPKVRWWQLPKLFRLPRSGRRRIWHARRNVEMAAGLVLRDVLRAPIRIVFTSAAQRRHKAFTKWLIRRMDAVIATSEKSGAYLEVPHDVIMHGIDLSRFRPKEQGDLDLASLGVPGKYAIGCFGRVRRQKGTDLFVDSMIELLPKYPDWTAVVAGRVTAENQAFARGLQDRVAAANLTNRIRFVGEVLDVPVWYRQLTVCVAPSRTEGFGLTPLEAMASGAAAVASDAGAYPELILQGQSGAVVPAGDLQAMRDAIEVYLADPELAKRHGLTGLEDVRKRFPLEREANSIGQVYARMWAHDGQQTRASVAR